MNASHIAIGAVLLVSPSAAEAATPSLHSVGREDSYATATFSAPGADDATMWMARSPALASDGSLRNTVGSDFLLSDEIEMGSWNSTLQLAPGTWYLQLEAEDYDCDATADPACVAGYSNVLSLRIPLPRLGIDGGRTIIRRGLSRRFGSSWTYGNFRRMRGCRRLGEQRTRCRRISWSIGDTSFHGSMTASRRLVGNTTRWRATGRIKVTNEYCVYVTKDYPCTESYRVDARGRG